MSTGPIPIAVFAYTTKVEEAVKRWASDNKLPYGGESDIVAEWALRGPALPDLVIRTKKKLSSDQQDNLTTYLKDEKLEGMTDVLRDAIQFQRLV